MDIAAQIERELERELGQLDSDLAEGRISREEHDFHSRAAERYAREALIEAAEDAYNDVMGNY